MTNLQFFEFLISMGYIFYVLWFNYDYNNFFESNRLLLNFTICLGWAAFGLLTNYSVQSGSFLFPLILIFLIRVFDFFSVKIRKRHFRPWSGRGIAPPLANMTDALLGLLLLFLNIILPIMLLNPIINGRFVNHH